MKPCIFSRIFAFKPPYVPKKATSSPLKFGRNLGTCLEVFLWPLFLRRGEKRQRKQHLGDQARNDGCFICGCFVILDPEVSYNITIVPTSLIED
jgi:hypothetical protein